MHKKGSWGCKDIFIFPSTNTNPFCMLTVFVLICIRINYITLSMDIFLSHFKMKSWGYSKCLYVCFYQIVNYKKVCYSNVHLYDNIPTFFPSDTLKWAGLLRLRSVSGTGIGFKITSLHYHCRWIPVPRWHRNLYEVTRISTYVV